MSNFCWRAYRHFFCRPFILVVFLGLNISARPSVACPSIKGVPDFNCDGKLSIAVIGDSLVYGKGDLKNGDQGGYILRATRKLPHITFSNLGVLGLRTVEAFRIVTKAFRDKEVNTYRDAIVGADVLFLDLGRNDRWLFGEPVETNHRLQRISATVRKRSTALVGYSPLIVTAVLMLPNRGSQGPWVKELNELIFDGSTDSNPANLRFDLVSKRLLSFDQIHPTSKGYDALTKVFLYYIRTIVPKYAETFRPDEDLDGVYDLLESQKFGTDPTSLDTDADGKNDGEEIFTTFTNPLDPTS